MTRLPLQTFLAIAALAIAACGSEAPPPAAVDEEVDELAAPVATLQAPAPAPAPTPIPLPLAPIVIPADAIGGTPVTNLDDAYARGSAGLQKYCVDEGMPCDSFYAKDTTEQGDHWLLMYFGTPRNQAMYINVRVYPDGRAEVER